MAKKKSTKNESWESTLLIVCIVLGLLLLASLTANALLLTVSELQGSPSAPTTQQQQQEAAPSPQGAAPEFDLEGAHAKGDEDAPVTIVEYSSYTCGFCGRFHTQTLPTVVEEYVDSGEVRFVYKHFRRNAQDAVIVNYAECAGEQGQFFEYTDEVFANQGQAGSTEALRGFAEDLGLDMAEFDACVEEDKYGSLVQEHYQEAVSNGVTGTPTFFINGEKVVGAQPLPVFEQAISAALE